MKKIIKNHGRLSLGYRLPDECQLETKGVLASYNISDGDASLDIDRTVLDYMMIIGTVSAMSCIGDIKGRWSCNDGHLSDNEMWDLL